MHWIINATLISQRMQYKKSEKAKCSFYKYDLLYIFRHLTYKNLEKWRIRKCRPWKKHYSYRCLENTYNYIDTTWKKCKLYDEASSAHLNPLSRAVLWKGRDAAGGGGMRRRCSASLNVAPFSTPLSWICPAYLGLVEALLIPDNCTRFLCFEIQGFFLRSPCIRLL